jgi:hypothetical protein
MNYVSWVSVKSCHINQGIKLGSPYMRVHLTVSLRYMILFPHSVGQVHRLASFMNTQESRFSQW